MSQRRSNLWMPAALAAACAGLGWAVYADLTAPIRPADAALPGRGNTPPVPVLPADPTFTLPELAAFRETVERPLFAPSRRPDAVAVPAGPAPQPLDLVLKGVILDGAERIALLSSAKDTDQLRLAVGERFREWTLTAVEPDAALFTRGREQVRLGIRFDQAPPRETAPRPRERGAAVTPRPGVQGAAPPQAQTPPDAAARARAQALARDRARQQTEADAEDPDASGLAP